MKRGEGEDRQRDREREREREGVKYTVWREELYKVGSLKRNIGMLEEWVVSLPHVFENLQAYLSPCSQSILSNHLEYS